MINDGEGVVTFTDKSHAEDAINQMDGQTVGASKIRCDWSLVEPSDSISSASSTNHSRRSSTDSDGGKYSSNEAFRQQYTHPLFSQLSFQISHMKKFLLKPLSTTHPYILLIYPKK